MTIEVLDPTFEEGAVEFALAARPADLRGATVGIVSNGKHNTRPFFEALGAELQTRYGVSAVDIVVKPNYSAPAGPEIFEQARDWQALVAGVGD